ncbi:pilin N-terminal domain-containing protein [Enterococcus sp. LJL99]
MKKLLFATLFSLVGLGFSSLMAVSAFAEIAETQTSTIEMVTLTVHELGESTSSDSKETTPIVGVPVSIYDLTAVYQTASQQGTVEMKKFSEEWSEKARKGTLNLGIPLITKITDEMGICTFSVPLKINEQYAVYLIVEETSTTVEQTGKTVPTVIIFPVVSPETGELLNPVEVYPKYVNGGTPEKPMPEKPQSEKPVTQKPSSREENYPNTNETTSSLSTIGLLLMVVVGSTWYINRRKGIEKNI